MHATSQWRSAAEKSTFARLAEADETRPRSPSSWQSEHTAVDWAPKFYLLLALGSTGYLAGRRISAVQVAVGEQLDLGTRVGEPDCRARRGVANPGARPPPPLLAILSARPRNGQRRGCRRSSMPDRREMARPAAHPKPGEKNPAYYAAARG